jgi:hypothetical protein
MASLHTKHPYLAYASKPNIVFPKEAGVIPKARADLALDSTNDFPSGAIAASATVPQSASDASAKTRIQTEP